MVLLAEEVPDLATELAADPVEEEEEEDAPEAGRAAAPFVSEPAVLVALASAVLGAVALWSFLPASGGFEGTPGKRSARISTARAPPVCSASICLSSIFVTTNTSSTRLRSAAGRTRILR